MTYVIKGEETRKIAEELGIKPSSVLYISIKERAGIPQQLYDISYDEFGRLKAIENCYEEGKRAIEIAEKLKKREIIEKDRIIVEV